MLVCDNQLFLRGWCLLAAQIKMTYLLVVHNTNKKDISVALGAIQILAHLLPTQTLEVENSVLLLQGRSFKKSCIIRFCVCSLFTCTGHIQINTTVVKLTIRWMFYLLALFIFWNPLRIGCGSRYTIKYRYLVLLAACLPSLLYYSLNQTGEANPDQHPFVKPEGVECTRGG